MSKLPQYARQAWPKTRQFVRYELEGRLTVQAGTELLRGWTHDVSQGGLGGVLAAKLAAGTEVAVDFQLPGKTPDIISVRAVVRFAKGFRYGFEFLNITPAQLSQVMAYCAHAKPLREQAPPA